MVELPLLIIIVILIVLAMRRGKRVVLESPVITQRPGQYHITLAPQLGGAQAFIETIAEQFSPLPPPDGNGRNVTPADEASHARFPLPNPLVEQVANRLSTQAGKSLVIPQAGEGANESLREFSVQGDLPTQYFEVSDPRVFSQSGSFYLLAIALRGGVLYFQAVNPQPLLRDADSHYKTLREFSESVLLHHPLSVPADEKAAEKLCATVDMIAAQMKISVKVLQDTV